MPIYFIACCSMEQYKLLTEPMMHAWEQNIWPLVLAQEFYGTLTQPSVLATISIMNKPIIVCKVGIQQHSSAFIITQVIVQIKDPTLLHTYVRTYVHNRIACSHASYMNIVEKLWWNDCNSSCYCTTKVFYHTVATSQRERKTAWGRRVNVVILL